MPNSHTLKECTEWQNKNIQRATTYLRKLPPGTEGPWLFWAHTPGGTDANCLCLQECLQQIIAKITHHADKKTERSKLLHEWAQHSGTSRKRVDCEKWSWLPLFLALAPVLKEDFHHFRGHRCLFTEEWMCRTWRKIRDSRAQPGGPWAALGASQWLNPKKNNSASI